MNSQKFVHTSSQHLWLNQLLRLWHFMWFHKYQFSNLQLSVCSRTVSVALKSNSSLSNCWPTLCRVINDTNCKIDLRYGYLVLMECCMRWKINGESRQRHKIITLDWQSWNIWRWTLALTLQHDKVFSAQHLSYY